MMPRLVRTSLAASVLSGLTSVQILAQIANTGAGGDPRTSVVRPEVSGKPSAVATTSIQSSFGGTMLLIGDSAGQIIAHYRELVGDNR